MLLSAPAIILTAAVTLLAVLVVIATQIHVGRVRGRTGITAPAMTGAPELLAALRVEGNTVEQFIIFLPSLWLAALYFQGWVAPALGLVWCVGRVVYGIGYMKDPKLRSPGYLIGAIATVALIVLAVIGLVQAWTAASAV